MDIDVLARAAFEAAGQTHLNARVCWRWVKAEGEWRPEPITVVGWDSLDEVTKERWRAVARAVLEAAGYEEIRSVLSELHKLDATICDRCRKAHNDACPEPSVCHRSRWVAKMEAALARAGKEA